MKRPVPFPGGGGPGGPSDPLDALLGRLPVPEVPPGLEERTLARLRLENALDGLLERGLPVTTPGGLAQRVLAGLAAQAADPIPTEPALAPHQAPKALSGAAPRSATAKATAPQALRELDRPLRRSGSRRWALFALAAGLLLALALFLRQRQAPLEDAAMVAQLPAVDRPVSAPSAPAGNPGPAGSGAETAPEAEFLAVLDLLDNWETLTDPAVLALELETDAAWWDEFEAALDGQPAQEQPDEG